VQHFLAPKSPSISHSFSASALIQVVFKQEIIDVASAIVGKADAQISTTSDGVC